MDKEFVRAECLYRVSTKGQVDHDDIPMQKIACRKFAEDNGWTIVKELQEKGISGFKVSADKRDAIQELRDDASNGRFDVLLVFMFDRLGRRDDETPFVVEWFSKQGIRIFSVKEGEQRFENHTDSLINYIRFWQSEGESKKTSVRIKTRLDQMRADGLYTGGPVRYGYRAVEKGRLNKKNKPVKDLEIDPEQAAIVREIFKRTVEEGAGSFMLANDLNARGIRTRAGAKFQSMTINRILKDRQYLGYLVTKDVLSPHLPELQIIEEDMFNRAEHIVNQRKAANEQWRNVPRQSSNGALVAGNLYCGDCGHRMTSSMPAEGAKRGKPEYICYYGANKRAKCDGQRAYLMERVDAVVLSVTQQILSTIQTTPKDESIEKRMTAEADSIAKQLTEIRQKATAAATEQEALEMEVSKALLGTSRFSEEMLSGLIEKKAKEKRQLQAKVAELEQQLKDKKSMATGITTYYDRFKGWAEEFRLASREQKRMIIAQLYTRIELRRGYKITFEIDWNYQQFIEGRTEVLEMLHQDPEQAIGA